MKLLDKYLGTTVLLATGLITLMLSGLLFFILFVNQLGDLGKGDYHTLKALVYIFLLLPYQIYLFFPVACLLGTLVGLGNLANQSELIIMRAAGFSVGQITQAVLKASLIAVLIVAVSGETWIPWLAKKGNLYKVQAMTQGQSLTTARGVWIRASQNDYLAISQIRPDNSLVNVVQFRFNPNHTLEVARTIGSLLYKGGAWQGYAIEETQFFDDKTVTKHYTHKVLDLSLNPLVLRLSSSQPDEMSLLTLARFLKAGEAQQRNYAYELVFWQRLFQPLATLVMMLLAIPFIFGPLRSSSMGSKLVSGISTGFGFYLLNHFLSPISQVYQWPPFIAALVPTLVFACLGLYLMRRVR